MRTNIWNPIFKGARSVVLTILTALCLVLLTGVGPAAADQCFDEAGYSCTYEIEELPLQPVPPFFKFQSRISQAKLPVGDVTFSTIYVNVKRGDAQLCSETFNNVMVRDSVLNLEIGRTMSCDLASKIAANDDLKFQVCIGNMENCLKPISLSSVPFAIKATYASLAQKAAKSNEAMQCHYAHRLTADRNLFTNKAIGKGYYDFHTPDTHQIDNLINLYDSGISVPYLDYYDGGYIQWMQVDPTSTNLHICAQKDDSQHDPMPLDELYMHAQVSRTLGQLVVDGPGNPSQLRMPLEGKALTVTRSGMDVHGPTDLYDNVYVGIHANGAAMPRQMRIDESHVLNDWGVANFYNDVFMGAQDEIDQDTCDINHHLNVDGTAFYSNFVQMGADDNLDSKIADINHHLNVDGTAFYSNFVEMGSAPDEKDLHVNHHLEVDGTSDFNNTVTMGENDDPNDKICDINHFLNVDGDALFTGKAVFTGKVEAFYDSDFNTNANFTDGTVTVESGVDLLDIYTDTVFRSGFTVSDGATATFATGSTATFDGVANFNDTVFMGKTVNIGTTANAEIMTIYHNTSFEGNVSIPSTSMGSLRLIPKSTLPATPVDGDIWMMQQSKGLFIQNGESRYIPSEKVTDNMVPIDLFSPSPALRADNDWPWTVTFSTVSGTYLKNESSFLGPDELTYSVPDSIPTEAEIYKIVVYARNGANTWFEPMLTVWVEQGGYVPPILVADAEGTQATGDDTFELNQNIQLSDTNGNRKRIHLRFHSSVLADQTCNGSELHSIEIYYRYPTTP